MSELEKVISGDSAHTPAANILESLPAELAHRSIDGAPHTIYEELWHITFWQQVTLDWIRGIETPFPDKPEDGFPGENEKGRLDWDALRERFFHGNREATSAALGGARRDISGLDELIQCHSRPGMPTRTMTVREQLESLGAHNAYHFGRIVLLRQLLRSWPPPAGGFSW